MSTLAGTIYFSNRIEAQLIDGRWQCLHKGIEQELNLLFNPARNPSDMGDAGQVIAAGNHYKKPFEVNLEEVTLTDFFILPEGEEP